MSMKTVLQTVTGAGLACLMSVGVAAAQDIERVEAGQLRCDVAGGVGLVLGSRKKMKCEFEKTDGTVEAYTGRIVKVGIDIGITKESVVWWVVLAPTGDQPKGALEGEYVGLTAEATVAVGAGANLLVGGGDQSFALQPLSLQTQEGLNIAGGIGSIKLEYVE